MKLKSVKKPSLKERVQLYTIIQSVQLYLPSIKKNDQLPFVKTLNKR